MTTASFVLGAALVAWGAFPLPASPPGRDVVGTAAPIQASPSPPVPAPAPVKQMFDEPPLIAEPAPPVRSRPERSRPQRARPARAPLYRDWRFWAISGSLLAASVVTTILVTRPGPQPFEGNFDPKVISLP